MTQILQHSDQRFVQSIGNIESYVSFQASGFDNKEYFCKFAQGILNTHLFNLLFSIFSFMLCEKI